VNALSIGRARPMKIVDVEVMVIDDGGAMMMVVVHAEDGLFGVGEVGVRSRQLAVKGALDHLAPLLLGQDLFRTEHLWQVMSRSGFYPADRTIASAMSAIDIALWDLKGKVLGVPVYDLLGGTVRDKVLCYCHIDGHDLQETVDNAQAARDLGWSVVRMKVPAQAGVFEPRTAVREAISMAAGVRDATGPDTELILDVHTRLDLPEATTLCRELEGLNLYFVEDPLRWENPNSYQRLRDRTTVPIAAGEQAASKWEIRHLIEQDLIDYARFDMCIVGGFTEAKKIAGWCEAHHVRTATHNPLGPIAAAASLHLNLTAPSFGIQEQYQIAGSQATDVFPVQMQMKGGWMLPPTTPGLGLKVDLEAARSHQVEPSDPPQLRRLDGSVTNW
jgi:L-alanine-DL-glutamate epimerase-like enolase superfamily enzyme